jgi:HrpA-like RNA helicase
MRLVEEIEDTSNINIATEETREEEQQAIAISSLLSDSHIIGLYGGMSQEDCNEELQQSNKRKIIFSTNVAETSITLEQLKVVIDPGKEKSIRYEPGSNPRMVTQYITRSSAEQRKGIVYYSNSWLTSNRSCWQNI